MSRTVRTFSPDCLLRPTLLVCEFSEPVLDNMNRWYATDRFPGHKSLSVG